MTFSLFFVQRAFFFVVHASGNNLFHEEFSCLNPYLLIRVHLCEHFIIVIFDFQS